MPDLRHFPVGGIDVSQAFARQPVREINGEYCGTTPVAINVRAFADGRKKGGVRPGLARYINAQVNSTYIIQFLGTITITDADAQA